MWHRGRLGTWIEELRVPVARNARLVGQGL